MASCLFFQTNKQLSSNNVLKIIWSCFSESHAVVISRDVGGAQIPFVRILVHFGRCGAFMNRPCCLGCFVFY